MQLLITLKRLVLPTHSQRARCPHAPPPAPALAVPCCCWLFLLLGDDATPQELNATNSMLVGKGVPTGTGENVVWELQVAINRASLSNDTANAWQAFANMWSALITNPGEGVQSDGSFHFHGNILYSGGYGADCECDAFSNVCT